MTPLSNDTIEMNWLREALGLPPDATPFPWQTALLQQLLRGELPRALDIPTGLGKTAVIALWLVARAHGAVLPRRLVYVVDRRAVVDQATKVTEDLRRLVDARPELKNALHLGNRSLPISTLRGQFIDNKEWLTDPASMAVVVGTVDMVGSRLLFEGYGTSRKMRPIQAGLLGADTLFVLDEAHLVPPFERLLESIADGVARFGPRDERVRSHLPRFRLLSLSATGRARKAGTFSLCPADLEHPVVRRRLDAKKTLSLVHPHSDGPWKLKDLLAEHAWNLTERGAQPQRIIVFCHKREDAVEAMMALRKRAVGDKRAGVAEVSVETELFVGGRRGIERERAAQRLAALGMIAGSNVPRRMPTFVFATSAGEVGVDLDADHMVSDLVAWERMVQRLGRVNRRGDGAARVVVIVEPLGKDVEAARGKDAEDRNEKERALVASADRKEAVARLLRELPRDGETFDASPGAIRTLKERASTERELQTLIEIASTPAPLHPELTRAVIDALSMTSLKVHTGRPRIGPWLRGWLDDDPPQTVVLWRHYLPTRGRGDVDAGQPNAALAAQRAEAPRVSGDEVEQFFEAAPPHPIEQLETETFRVTEWLVERATELLDGLEKNATQSLEDDRPRLHASDVVAFILSPAGELLARKRLIDLASSRSDKTNKKRVEALERQLQGATLVIDDRLGGLEDGLLRSASSGAISTIDGPGDASRRDTRPEDGAPGIPFRIRTVDKDDPPSSPPWYARLKYLYVVAADDEVVRWLVIEKWRDDAATEEDRSAGNPQSLIAHQSQTEKRARELALRLGLAEPYVEMLAVAAALHDEGKRAPRWQRAFNAPKDGGPYAKTRGPVKVALLDGYRHELGSLPYASESPRLASLPDELRDLALHLIAAHHGFARPLIGTTGCDDAPPSLVEARAREVALRFSRQERCWGPWGLAWWEAILRAADQQASRDNELAGSDTEAL